MNTKVIQIGYASDLERYISADTQEIVRARKSHRERLEQEFLSTVRSVEMRTFYKNIFSFLSSWTTETLTERKPLLDWFAKGMAQLFPTAESACFMPNANKIPLWGTNGNGPRNPNPVIPRAAEVERVLFSRSPFALLDFARKHIDTLPYIDSMLPEKKVEQIFIDRYQPIIVIPIAEPDGELLGCLYVKLLVPLSAKKLKVLNAAAYSGHSDYELKESFSTALLYSSYQALQLPK